VAYGRAPSPERDISQCDGAQRANRSAAQSVSATITGPLDGQGNVKVHEQGTANVNVLGNVSAQAAIPATQFSRHRFLSGGFDDVSGPDPAGRNYAITSVSFGNRGDTPAEVSLFAVYGTTTGDCTFTVPINPSDEPSATVPAHDTVSMTFPQPFVIEAQSGANSCFGRCRAPSSRDNCRWLHVLSRIA
jgi:hypothetical protein